MSGSSLKIKQFDSDALSEQPISGKCAYTFFSAGGYECKVKALFCGPTAVGCGHKVTIQTPFLQYAIELFRGIDGVIQYNGQPSNTELSPDISIVQTGIFTDLTFKNNFTVRWSEGKQGTECWDLCFF